MCLCPCRDRCARVQDAQRDLAHTHSRTATSRWPQRPPAGCAAARAATTPFSGYSPPGTPPSAQRAPAARRSPRTPSWSALGSLRAPRISASPRGLGSRERAGEGTAAGARGPEESLSAAGSCGPSCGSGCLWRPRGVAESGGARARRQHGGAAGQAGLRARAAGAVHAGPLPNAASRRQEAPQDAPVPAQLLLHQGHRLLRGL